MHSSRKLNGNHWGMVNKEKQILLNDYGVFYLYHRKAVEI